MSRSVTQPHAVRVPGRRAVIGFGGTALLGALLGGGKAQGQSSERVWRLGLLGLEALPPDQPSPFRTLLERLRAQGFDYGRNLDVVWGLASGSPQAFEASVEQLVRQRVDVLLAGGNGPAAIALRGTSSIPIVAWTQDAVEAGLVVSLQRPGRNLTGIDSQAASLSAKRLELMARLQPEMVRSGGLLGVLFNPQDAGASRQVEQLRLAAQKSYRDLVVQPIPVSTASDIERQLGRVGALRLGAMMLITDALTAGYFHPPRTQPDLMQVPTYCELPKFVLRGCLASYGPSTEEYVQISARLIGRLFQGVSPQDLPMEQPMRTELFLNLRSARALGVQVPDEIGVRADQVID